MLLLQWCAHKVNYQYMVKRVEHFFNPLNNYHKFIINNLLLDPKVVRRYGGGTGPTFLEGLNCEGDESNLLLCSHDRIEALHDCSYGTAGVSCCKSMK